MHMVHAPGFLNLVNDAKKRIDEISVAEVRARLGGQSPDCADGRA